MTQFISITNALTPALVTSSETAITGLHTILDVIKISLTEAQTKSLYKVGPIRTSEAQTIYTKLMKPYPQTMSSNVTIAMFDALTQEGIDSNILEALLLSLAAIVGGHGEIVQNDRFFIALQCLDNARVLGKTVPAIQSMVDEITAEFFMKAAAAKKTPTLYTIAPASVVTINGITTGKYFTNSGKTILTLLKIGGLVADTITVFPGSGEIIPASWTRIVVTNVSELGNGAFSLFIQS